MGAVEILVLGGTRFVGRALVREALDRGDAVTTLTRGTGPGAPGVRALHADRRDRAALAAALGDGAWDAVVDTWSQEPAAVGTAARLLAGRARHYGYVSSRSVYRWPPVPGADEDAPVVDADPAGTGHEDYAAAKRGAELAALAGFDGPVLLARAGLVLGPHEDVGRLPWWLGRLARGGRVLAPGPRDRPLQLIDARDLARWMLDAADRGLGGAFNAVSPPDHTTTGELLETALEVTGSRAELVWATPEQVAAAGIEPWTQLPIWVPPTGELAGLHAGDVTRALAAGLLVRPVRETVADTWAWLLAEGWPPPRADRPPVGLDPDVEARVLAEL